MQQLELALLGSSAAMILDLLMLATQSPMASTPLPSRPFQVTTAPSITIPSGKVPPPPLVPIVGVTSMVEASTCKKRALTPSTLTDPEAVPSKSQKIMPTPISSSPSSKLPSIMVLELVLLKDALPEQVNCPGGCKNYQCQLCAFQHTNNDSMLMHTWQPLEIMVSCPMCSKGVIRIQPPSASTGGKHIPSR